MGAHLHTSTIHGVSKVVALHSDLLEGSIFLVAEGQRVRFYSCCMCESTLLLRDFAPSSATEPLPSGGDGAGLVQSAIAATFDLGNFWQSHESDVPAFAYVLRAILTNSPNSVPPERVFSRSSTTPSPRSKTAASATNYIELSLQVHIQSPRAQRQIGAFCVCDCVSV
mmetsp:Transcript_23431/g.64523  ORF Transcript_23431/g.64523 Transcript_23431/m.64523 type:complete len:168 (+) Transcript_23431:1120-1623(+)